MNKMKEVKKILGEEINEGRPDKKEVVLEWRQSHPYGRKIDCQRDTGLSRPTVLKWWDSGNQTLDDGTGSMVDL
jgi:hypothetical protein